MILDDRCGLLRKINATNGVDASVVYPPLSYLQPTGDGYYPLQQAAGGSGAKRVLLIPFGTAAQNKTFTMEVYGIRKTLGENVPAGTVPIWIAYPIASFLCTLGSLTGLANAYVDTTQFFCDTIAASTAAIGGTPADYNIRTPTDDTPASVDVAVYGASDVAVKFGVGSSQATGANALIAPL